LDYLPSNKCLQCDRKIISSNRLISDVAVKWTTEVYKTLYIRLIIIPVREWNGRLCHRNPVASWFDLE